VEAVPGTTHGTVTRRHRGDETPRHVVATTHRQSVAVRTAQSLTTTAERWRVAASRALFRSSSAVTMGSTPSTGRRDAATSAALATWSSRVHQSDGDSNSDK
jgi:hypothetical protein